MDHAVLFVDDESNILNAIQRMLRDEPYAVHCVTRPTEVFELLNRVPCQVIVTDQRMPGMSGSDLLATLRQQRPDIIRIMMTGHSDMSVAVEAINRGEVFRLVTKPWSDPEFRATIRQALDHHDLKVEIERLSRIAREQNRKLQDMNRSLETKVRDRTKQLAEKHNELRTAYIQTIRALAEAVDAKDPYTRGHSERVGLYASKLAREMTVPQNEIEKVYIAGLLHDVGKIGVPDHIISKPTSLDEAEYEIMKRHPEIGARILEPVEFLTEVVACVRHHHEWFDGCERGYPAGISGDRIPLIARIILVADTVEAMTSDRPYRDALTLEHVTKELRQYSGSQFDPACADGMLRLLDREGEQFFRKDTTFDIYEFIGS